MKKETNKYYFSVEGETEQWYLEWLEKTIQSDLGAFQGFSYLLEYIGD